MPKKAQTPEEHAEIQARLISVAREIFDREGIAAVTVRNVARQSGYSPAALYRYFDGHLAIVRAIWRDSVALHEQRAIAAAAAEPHPAGKIRAFMLAYAEFAEAEPAAFRSTFLQHWAPPEIAETFAREGVMPGETREPAAYKMLRQTVRDGVGMGVFARVDPMLAAQTIWGAIHGVVALSMNFGEFPFVERRRRVEHVIQTVLAGLRPAG